ncbi:hypothetical protein [uncultured Roseibium sp.]|uniref:hypothetical protein n=1 Tax=uncultured Roseibium sp. TaxID=1936171 RepID=UPI002610B523|nr:hypothetical protein [uncultured Roseibium sp.]
MTTPTTKKHKEENSICLSNNVAKNLHFIYNCFSVLTTNKEKKNVEGVSGANARTQMAQAKQTSRLFGAVAGAAMTAAALFTPVAANAQEVTSVANTVETSRTAEIAELRAADRAATAYAKEHGVAILLHVGMDIQNHEQPEDLLQWVENQFKESFAKHGIDIGIFPRTNDARGSGLTYHVGDHIYSPPGSNGLFDLQTASEIVPDVVKQARIALELANADIDAFQSSQPGG